MTTISTSVQQSLPRVSYVKAMDVWTFSCLFFVCASLLEISIVNVMVRKEKRRLDKLKEVKNRHRANGAENQVKSTELDSMLAVNATDNVQEQTEDESEVTVKESPNKYEKIHVWCGVMFPLTFTVFNFIYWWWYVSMYTQSF